MRAEEFMVCDFVRINKDVCFKKGTIVEVVGIDSCNYLPKFNLKGNVTCKNTNRDYFTAHGGVWCDFLEPIPLTTEILEKNGFIEIEEDIYKCSVGEVYIEIGIYKPMFIYIGARVITPDEVYDTEISSITKANGGDFFVHDLQHALRLCGIDKKIKL